ncbi:MAG: hypothetical protein F6K25_19840 [Okeania sp. SIO2G4]|uniref:hypothetical protein n=1 Tax=unclassified Okeania TaxID=2634635 RepID=UPI0013B9C352|nr:MULTISPECIES: hypothetical protein [unclassified Okeania]NEP38484.1 hypothetical protein [Okeania sp. SIO2H7]NEP70402.1 hypothetical protein [Okeania sp. SIO2G5]NEP91636.1 hypothetical protein [Okeania sp. SIO2F5]NEQ92799.1 hypothetical protein [Okeania sp. SIO2G4]
MSNWEFLLQKEGDRTWLPLESSDVEILEGRYRIVAHTHIANTEVQIQIIHDSLEEVPPLRRVQKRSSLTHSQGLISIIPFTRLKPGKWEFRCQSKPTTSSVKAKQHIVHLEVLPTDYDDSDFSQTLDVQSQELYPLVDSETQENELIANENISVFSSQISSIDHPEENTEKKDFELTTKSDDIELLDAQIEEKNSTNLLDDEEEDSSIQAQNQLEEQSHPSDIKDTEEKLKELTETLRHNSSILGQVEQQQAIEQAIELEANQQADTNITNQTNSTINYPLQLTLNQASYTAQPGEALIISGQIILDNQAQNIQSTEGLNHLISQNTLTKNDSSIPENNTPIVNGNLKICLRNPQTSEILIDIQQALPEQVTPIIFACTVNVPENIKTRLILGQIILTNNTATLANTSFTITAPLQNWLTAIDDNFTEDDYQEMAAKITQAARKSEQKSPSFQELVEKINQVKPQKESDIEQPLPPQIYQPVEGEEDSGTLELPTFGNPPPETMAKDKTLINELLAKSNAPQDSDELDDVWEDSNKLSERTSLQAEEIEESESESESKTTEEEEVYSINQQNLVPFPTKFAPRKEAFKALNLEDRFFSRLNSLVNDSELSQWMKASSLSPTEELENISEDQHKTGTDKLQDSDSINTIVDDEELASDNSDEINWEAQEFVVEDEQIEQQEKQWNDGLANVSQSEDESISRQPYILPDDQPVPVPHLEVLAKDVIAGKDVKVRVQLPEGLPGIYVKIWVYDRQAQTIVAGPRWLTDFIPNGMGQVEVITELYIAYGCLEIKIEAIAAEVQTNRESHRVVIEHLVVPPPPPILPFDDLNLS